MTLFLSWLVIPSYVVINNDEDTKILKQALVCILEDHSENRIENMQALQIHTVSLQCITIHLYFVSMKSDAGML